MQDSARALAEHLHQLNSAQLSSNLNKHLGIVDLVIVQIIHIDPILLLILRPAISNPAVWVVIDVFILEVFPTGMRHGLQRMKGGSCACHVGM